MAIKVLLLAGLILGLSVTIVFAGGDVSSTTPKSPTADNGRQSHDQQDDSTAINHGAARSQAIHESTAAQHHEMNRDGGTHQVSNENKNHWWDAVPSNLLLAVFTLCLVIVGVFQFVVLKRSLKIAAESTETARKVVLSTKRAFVIHKDVTWEREQLMTIDGSIPSYKKVVWALRVKWGNSGDVFANATISANCQVLDDQPPKDCQFPYVPLDDHLFKYKCYSGAKVSLWPRAEILSEPLFIQGDDKSIELIIKGILRLFVWGEASYEDVLSEGTTHHTRFCAELTFRSRPPQPPERQPPTYLTDYNYAD